MNDDLNWSRNYQSKVESKWKGKKVKRVRLARVEEILHTLLLWAQLSNQGLIMTSKVVDHSVGQVKRHSKTGAVSVDPSVFNGTMLSARVRQSLRILERFLARHLGVHSTSRMNV
jgi:hypothetical protein